MHVNSSRTQGAPGEQEVLNKMRNLFIKSQRRDLYNAPVNLFNLNHGKILYHAHIFLTLLQGKANGKAANTTSKLNRVEILCAAAPLSILWIIKRKVHLYFSEILYTL